MQNIPAVCDVPECQLKTSKMRRSGPNRAVEPWKKNCLIVSMEQAQNMCDLGLFIRDLSVNEKCVNVGYIYLHIRVTCAPLDQSSHILLVTAFNNIQQFVNYWILLVKFSSNCCLKFFVQHLTKIKIGSLSYLHLQ